MAKKSNKHSLLIQLLFPIIMLLTGIAIIVFRSSLLNVALYIIGVLLIVSAIIRLVKKDFLVGAITLVIGIAIILVGALLLELALLIIGIILLAVGIVNIVRLFIDKKTDILNFISPIVMIVVGVLLVWGGYSKILDVLLIVSGVFLIVYSIYQTILILSNRK